VEKHFSSTDFHYKSYGYQKASASCLNRHHRLLLVLNGFSCDLVCLVAYVDDLFLSHALKTAQYDIGSCFFGWLHWDKMRKLRRPKEKNISCTFIHLTLPGEYMINCFSDQLSNVLVE